MLSLKFILLIVPFCAAVSSEETAVELPEDMNQYTAAVFRNIPHPIPNPIFVQSLVHNPPVVATTEKAPIAITPTIPVYHKPWTSPTPNTPRPVLRPYPAPVRPHLEPITLPPPTIPPSPATPTEVIVSTPKYLPLVEDPFQNPLESQDNYYYCEQEDGYYALENRCSLYIHCKNHRALEYACPLGQHYDRKVPYPHFPCSSPAQALCENYEHRPTELPLPTVLPTLTPVIPTHPPVVPTHPPVVPTYPPVVPTHPPVVPTHPPVVPTHPPVVPTFPPKPPVVTPILKPNAEGRCERAYGYFPIQGQCDTYVECKNYLYLEYYCPDGLNFNPNAEYPEYPCAYPSEVPCLGKSMQPAHSTAECPRLYGLFPTGESDCSRYVSCQEGLATIMNCPSGLVFNRETSTCDYVENVPNCNPEVFHNIRCPEPRIDEHGHASEEILNFRYGKSCRYYVGCRLGHPRLLSCNEGLAFDESLGRCVDSDYVHDCTN